VNRSVGCVIPPGNAPSLLVTVMNKILLFIAAVGLVNTVFNLGNYASASDSTSPHIDSKFEFPHHRWATVRQTILVHIPSGSPSLTSLIIDVPENFNFQVSQIEIVDLNRTIDAPIARQGQRLKIGFARPIAPGTQLQINFNSVERNMRGQSSTYYLYGTTTNGTDSFFGEAYFPQQ
jgi:hypothetical protein